MTQLAPLIELLLLFVALLSLFAVAWVLIIVKGGAFLSEIGRVRRAQERAFELVLDGGLGDGLVVPAHEAVVAGALLLEQAIALLIFLFLAAFVLPLGSPLLLPGRGQVSGFGCQGHEKD